MKVTFTKLFFFDFQLCNQMRISRLSLIHLSGDFTSWVNLHVVHNVSFVT